MHLSFPVDTSIKAGNAIINGCINKFCAWHRTTAHCEEKSCSQMKSIRLSRGSEVSNNDYSIELYSCGENISRGP